MTDGLHVITNAALRRAKLFGCRDETIKAWWQMQHQRSNEVCFTWKLLLGVRKHKHTVIQYSWIWIGVALKLFIMCPSLMESFLNTSDPTSQIEKEIYGDPERLEHEGEASRVRGRTPGLCGEALHSEYERLPEAPSWSISPDCTKPFSPHFSSESQAGLWRCFPSNWRMCPQASSADYILISIAHNCCGLIWTCSTTKVQN